ncbi:MAG: hypothetical protein CR982_03755 [Candidatus Cloacimonadota bacterium]|nr:MAG: hypothetical protein CR982_03755 [Candidatus Cloacimonadota bacterium]PIE79233.1 MAG: hypothetical protein CSA15_03930 [Candidatus Delongbacteria bacterium]
MLRYIVTIIVLYTSVLPSSFSIARVKYNGGGDWYSDPTSIKNLLNYFEKSTGISCENDEKVTEISEEEIFNYPYLYLTGHGKVELNDNELKILRKHLLNGGFLHADDNYGMDNSFREVVKKLFPKKELVKVPFSHPIYNIKYKFPNGVPKIHKHDGKPPVGYGIFHNERLILFYSYESDLGDGWEDIEVHNNPQPLREKALKMGTNLILYFLNS